MTEILQTKVESNVRDQAVAILAQHGMTIDDAVSRFLKRIISDAS